jgi:hypothetical protein
MASHADAWLDLGDVFNLSTVGGTVLTQVGSGSVPSDVGVLTALSASSTLTLDGGVELIITVPPPTVAYTVEDLFIIALVKL